MSSEFHTNFKPYVPKKGEAYMSPKQLEHFRKILNQLKTELSMTTAQYSYVVSAFLISYAVMQPVCGYIIDRVGLKKGFAFLAAAWSAANMLHALAGSWTDLVLFRMLLGGAEAALVPAGMKAICSSGS